MTPPPTISVIIPVWNGAERIAKTLENLQAQIAPRERYEVIVVDNGSTDETAQIVQRFSFVRYLHEPKPGSYSARNLALDHARGEGLLFTDGDCVASQDWVSRALDHADKGLRGRLVAGRITLFREGNANPAVAAWEELFSFNQQTNVADKGYSVTANFLCHAQDMAGVGGFRGDLLSGGDADCSHRLVASGVRLEYDPQLIVAHPIRASLGELIAKRRRIYGGMFKRLEGERWRRGQLLVRIAGGAARQASLAVRSDLRPACKLGAAGVSLFVGGISLLEGVKLALGGKPYRS